MIELQRKLLGDKVRNDAFAEALRRVIVPQESIIADIGSGTGFLSFLVSKLGAKQCYGYEVGGIVETSRQLAKRNGINNCTFFRTHSTDVKHPPKVDVVVSETLGNYALEENILETMEDAKRFLKPMGLLLPAKISQFVCPVTTDRLYREIDVWLSVGFGLDFSEARERTMNNMYVKTIHPEDLLMGAEREWDTVDFSISPFHGSGFSTRGVRSKKNLSIRTGKQSFTVKKPVTVYGFALWWNAELVPGVHLSTSPFEAPTHWEQIFLPLLQPVKLASGSTLELTLTSDTRWQTKINLQWSVRVLDATKKEVSVQRLDMRKGYIL